MKMSSKNYLIKILNHLLHSAYLIEIFLLIITITKTNAAGRPLPSPVQINKCCRHGEYLDRNQTCIAGASDKWVPSVFMINRKILFKPRGEAPMFFRFIENQFPNTCTEREYFIGEPNKILLFSNGSLYLTEKSLFINFEDYCVDKDSALVCFPRIHGVDSLIAPRKLSKVKKCCTRNLVYNRENKTCENLRGAKHPINRANFLNSSAIDIIYGFPHCTSYAIAGIFRQEFLDVESGNLTLESGKGLQSEEFCLEHTIGAESDDFSNVDAMANNRISVEVEELNRIHIFTCSEHFSKAPEIFTVPINNMVAEQQNLRFVLLSAGLLISVIFLSATLATGFLMPSNHHVLHWKCQSYYVSCLLIGDLLLAISQIAGNSITGGYCITMAIFMHFFFLAAFFWLNTMCFNIWWTFRDFRPTSLEKNQEVLRLRIYSIYAWGFPLIIVSVAAILDLIPDGDNFLRPRFGERKCWFYGDMEILTYFFGPIGILLCINMLLFGSTARQLTCGLWKIDDVKSTTEKAALGRVCLKLVIVMGVTWIADIVSWMVGGHWYIWCITDLINALQGVFIFIVVGCQPQVWSAVKRIWTSKTGRGVTTNTNGPQHSSSSHGLPSIGETITNNTLTNTTSNTTSTKVPMETVC